MPDTVYMKKIITLATVALTLTACATVAPMSYQEHCALQGMKLEGVSNTSGTSYAHATSWNTNDSINAYGVINAQSVSCVVPQTQQDACEVRKFGAAAIPKAEYNSGIGGKRLITGTGYFLFVVPGIIAKLAYDQQLDEVMKKSKENYEKTGCRMPASKQ